MLCQEYFVIPTGATSFSEAMQIGCEVYHTLGKIIKSKFGGDATLIGGKRGSSEIMCTCKLSQPDLTFE